MTALRSKLNITGIRPVTAEFVCRLVDLVEYEDRLEVPTVHPYGNGGVELVWYCHPNTLRIIVTSPGAYKFIAEIDGQGRVLEGSTHDRELIQVLRNMLYWLWDDPW